MLRRLIWQRKDGQKGITGIETAIILIAFVVVAAVFSYAILSAGLFASQKSSEAIYKGLKEAESATTMRGALIAAAETANLGNNGFISQFTLTVATTMRGAENDFTPPTATAGHTGLANANSANKVTISYFDPYQKVDDLYWTLTKLGACDADDLLDVGELFQITVGDPVTGQLGGNLANALTRHLGPNTRFTLVVTTPTGSTLSIERTTPPVIDKTMSLN
jgi:archaeal flagellin FlaB